MQKVRKYQELKSNPFCIVVKLFRIHFLAGKLLPGDENQANGCAVLETLTNNLRGILPQLTERGITALIEPINTGTIPGYALCDFDAGMFSEILMLT